MGLKQEERRIGDVTYRVTQLGVTPGKKLLVRLVKLIGPVIAKGADGASESVSLRGPGLARMILEFCERLTLEDLDEFCSVLSAQTEYSVGDGRWLVLKNQFELHFAGKYDELFQWLAFALEVQFGGFFSVLGGLRDRHASQEAAYPSSSQQV